MGLKNKEGGREVGEKHFICPPKFHVLLVFFGLTTQQRVRSVLFCFDKTYFCQKHSFSLKKN